MSDAQQPRGITWDSTREEVLAAVEEHDRRVAGRRIYRDDEIDWRGDALGERKGCYWSKDGQVRVHMGHPGDEDPSLTAQQLAGQEDQSADN